MATAAGTVDEDGQAEGAEGGNAAATARPKRKRLLMLASAAVVLLGGGGAAGWYVLAQDKAAEASAPAALPTAEELVDVPVMTVNLRTSEAGPKMLRVHLMLVPGTRDKEALAASLPLVIDAFQPFLRELRPEDIAGSAATFRIKEEMLVRANRVLGRGSVRDVLIQDLVQQ